MNEAQANVYLADWVRQVHRQRQWDANALITRLVRDVFEYGESPEDAAFRIGVGRLMGRVMLRRGRHRPLDLIFVQVRQVRTGRVPSTDVSPAGFHIQFDGVYAFAGDAPVNLSYSLVVRGDALTMAVQTPAPPAPGSRSPAFTTEETRFYLTVSQGFYVFELVGTQNGAPARTGAAGAGQAPRH